jgi:hypothetical protein
MTQLRNPRHESFCQAWILGLTARQAYVAAGYRDNTGNASVFSRRPEVVARIQELEARRAVQEAYDLTELLALNAGDIARIAGQQSPQALRERRMLRAEAFALLRYLNADQAKRRAAALQKVKEAGLADTGDDAEADDAAFAAFTEALPARPEVSITRPFLTVAVVREAFDSTHYSTGFEPDGSPPREGSLRYAYVDSPALPELYESFSPALPEHCESAAPEAAESQAETSQETETTPVSAQPITTAEPPAQKIALVSSEAPAHAAAFDPPLSQVFIGSSRCPGYVPNTPDPYIPPPPGTPIRTAEPNSLSAL